MTNDPAVLLLRTGEKSRDIDERQKGHVECVTHTDESRCLIGCVDVETTRHHTRLIGDDADAFTVQAYKSSNDVLRIIRLNLEQCAVVRQCVNQFFHVIRRTGILRNERVQLPDHFIGIAETFSARRSFEIVLRQEAQQLFNLGETLLFVGSAKMRDAAHAIVRHRTTERLG